MSSTFTLKVIDFDGRRQGTSKKDGKPYDFYSCYCSTEGDNPVKANMTSPVIDGENPPIVGYSYPVIVTGVTTYSDNYGKHFRWQAAFDPDYVS